MKYTIDPWSYPLWAMLLLTVPLDWLTAAAVAAAVHELSHIFMILLLGGTVKKLAIHPRGAVLFTSPMEPEDELLCALAGPAGSFCLAIFYQLFPRIAICAVIQGCFNMLPVYPLDGGRALRCVMTLLSRKKPCKPG